MKLYDMYEMCVINFMFVYTQIKLPKSFDFSNTTMKSKILDQWDSLTCCTIPSVLLLSHRSFHLTNFLLFGIIGMQISLCYHRGPQSKSMCKIFIIVLLSWIQPINLCLVHDIWSKLYRNIYTSIVCLQYFYQTMNNCTYYSYISPVCIMWNFEI